MIKHTAALLLAAFSVSAAYAQSSETAPDGTILFTGAVLDQTCEVETDSKQLLVNLPFIGKNSLANNGATAGETPFEIRLKNCKQDGDGFLPYLHFQGSSIDPDSGNLNNLAEGEDGGAQNVQVQLLSVGLPLHLNGDQLDNLADYSVLDDNGSDLTLRYSAQYYANGTVSPGVVLTTVDYVIAYL